MDIAGEQFNAREQAAHAAHVPVAIAANPVAQAFDDEHPVPISGQRFQDGLELEVGPGGLGPEFTGHRSVGGEDEDDTLGGPFPWGGLKRGQPTQKRQDRCREAQISQESATCGGGDVVLHFPGGFFGSKVADWMAISTRSWRMLHPDSWKAESSF